MSWILLLIGLAVWVGAHALKRVAPDARAALGAERGKGIIAITLFASIVLIILGYRTTPMINVWTPPAFLTHLNYLLVLIAFYLLSPAPKKGKLLRSLRHPMLIGFALWATAHLLVNGDLTAILTFGTLLAWSVVTMQVINRADTTWSPSPGGEIKWDGIGIAGALVLFAVIGLIHGWIGPSPFG